MKLRYFALITWLVLFSGNTIIASTIAATNDVAEKYAGDWVVNVEETDLLR